MDGYVNVSSVETKNGQKTILHQMHIDLPEGAVIAILGPSGSGKTSLVNVLTDNVESNIRAVGKGTRVFFSFFLEYSIFCAFSLHSVLLDTIGFLFAANE